MYTVGLTGGIGSGKSTVSKFFAELGVAVSDADIAARAVVARGEPALDAIARHFGSQVIRADGSLDRSRLRQCVFRDDRQKKWLEQLLHPLIGERIRQELSEATGHYAILSSPLLFETTQHELTQRKLVVDVPEEEQLARACRRDNSDRAQIRAIMDTQCGREQRLAQADDVIDNSGSTQETRAQVAALHRKYLRLAASWQPPTRSR